MHHIVFGMYAYPDQVTPVDSKSLSKAAHPGPLLSVDGVEWVVAAGEGANLDDNPSGTVIGDDVDFPTGDSYVAGDDPESLRF